MGMPRKIKRNVKAVIRLIRKVFFLPIPRTAPLEWYLHKFLPSGQFVKQSIALTTAIIFLSNQVLFAQPFITSMPPGTFSQMMANFKLKIGRTINDGKIVLRALPFGYDYRKGDRDKRKGYMSPEDAVRREEQKKKLMATASLLMNAKGSTHGGIPGQYDESLTPTQYLQNIQAMKGIQGDIARLRSQAQKGAADEVGTYLLYKDGRKVFFQNGLATKIFNEKVTDARGNVTIRNTTNMEYNNRRLLTSFIVDETDSKGNVTLLRRKNINYSEDSVYYAGKDTVAPTENYGL